MATYTGAGKAKRGFGGRIWIAIVAFLAGSALAIAIVAHEPVRSTAPARPIVVGTPASRDPATTQVWLKLLWGSGKTLSYRAGSPIGGSGKG